MSSLRVRIAALLLGVVMALGAAPAFAADGLVPPDPIPGLGDEAGELPKPLISDDPTVLAAIAMLKRAIRGELPTAEDRLMAERALRTWQQSEKYRRSGDFKMEEVFDRIAKGERLPVELMAKAREIYRGYLTPDGIAERAGLGPDGQPLPGSAPGAPHGPVSQQRTGTGDASDESTYGSWVISIMLIVIVITGLAATVAAARYSRPTQGDRLP